MKDGHLEKKIIDCLRALRRQSRDLVRMFNENAPLYSFISYSSKLQKSLSRLDHLLIERFMKENLQRYKYPGDRGKLIRDVVRLHRYSG